VHGLVGRVHRLRVLSSVAVFCTGVDPVNGRAVADLDEVPCRRPRSRFRHRRCRDSASYEVGDCSGPRQSRENGCDLRGYACSETGGRG
jgi:hypothetical protein